MEDELGDLADWLLELTDGSHGEDRLLTRWATDLHPQVVVWLRFRQWQAETPPLRRGAAESV